MRKGYVKCTTADVMSHPMAKSERVDELLCGMEVELLDETVNGYFGIRTYYKYEGYVHKNSLLLSQKRTMMFRSIRPTWRFVKMRYCDVLSEPSIQSYRIASLTTGAIVSLISTGEDGWSRVSLCDGEVGYIRTEYLMPYKMSHDPKNPELRSDLVKTAQLYLGAQYRWGGKSPLGVDCSGFCSMVYMLNGIFIHRDAKLVQGFPVHEIEYSDLKEGDLIYSEGHVMLYVGGGEIIHSSSSVGYVAKAPVPAKESVLCCGSIFS